MCMPRSPKNNCRCKVERTPSFTQPRLMLELAKKPAHGYELIEHLSREEGNAPDPGNFYRVLRSLEEEGLVCSSWETPNSGPARRIYELTEQGYEILHAWVIVIQQTQQSLVRFMSDYETLFLKTKE